MDIHILYTLPNEKFPYNASLSLLPPFPTHVSRKNHFIDVISNNIPDLTMNSNVVELLLLKTRTQNAEELRSPKVPVKPQLGFIQP